MDWIVDPNLDRSKVSKENAAHIRERMKQCNSLIYALSDKVGTSKWTTWELGFFDGFKEKVAILPMQENSWSDFKGEEFLTLYPLIDKGIPKGEGKEILKVHTSSTHYTRLTNWLNKNTSPGY